MKYASRLDLMTASQNELLVLVVSLSMGLYPSLFALINDWLTKRLTPRKEAIYEQMPDDESPVIIAGLGRFGQIFGRVLAARKIHFTSLDISSDQVDFIKRFGNKVHYGDASRVDLLRAAKADTAKIFILALDDVEASIRTAETVIKHFPHLNIFARARNRQHAYRLTDLGITPIQRETFLSALDLARDMLVGLGMARPEAERTMLAFREHD